LKGTVYTLHDLKRGTRIRLRTKRGIHVRPVDYDDHSKGTILTLEGDESRALRVRESIEQIQTQFAAGGDYWRLG